MQIKSAAVALAMTLLLSGVTHPVWAEEPAVQIESEEAVTASEKEIDGEMMAEASPSPEVNVEYVMPFPGITPDHPLFFLKRLRDQLMDLLISDPVKKAEFTILKSDKYLGMAVMLKDKNRWDLVSSTVEQSNENYQRAVGMLGKIKESGITQFTSLRETLVNSGNKHREVISLLGENANGEQMEMITRAETMLEEQIANIPQ